MVAATYGFVSAFGQNIALIPTLTTAMKWFPNRKGTAMGVVVGGFGGGAMVFNQIQTAIVNFENYKVLLYLYLCRCISLRWMQFWNEKLVCISRIPIGKNPKKKSLVSEASLICSSLKFKQAR